MRTATSLWTGDAGHRDRSSDQRRRLPARRPPHIPTGRRLRLARRRHRGQRRRHLHAAPRRFANVAARRNTGGHHRAHLSGRMYTEPPDATGFSATPLPCTAAGINIRVREITTKSVTLLFNMPITSGNRLRVNWLSAEQPVASGTPTGCGMTTPLESSAAMW